MEANAGPITSETPLNLNRKNARTKRGAVSVYQPSMRIAVLWTRLSGYMNSGLKALYARGNEVLVFHEEPGDNSPYSEASFSWIERRHRYHSRPDDAFLRSRLQDFKPDIILASWHVPAYQRTCAALRGHAIRVGCTDSQWRGTARQWGGSLLSPFHIRRFYDALFVPGERQAQWARRMGYPEERIWRGLYCCEGELFLQSHAARDWNRGAFLYVGRLAEEKGIRILAQAYRHYSERCVKPWPLIVAGDGPLRDHFHEIPGCQLKGFLQPTQLPAVFAESTCFVMASTFEPWCVSINEAAASGLPLIATAECGSTVHLLQDAYNGYVVTPGSENSLLRSLERMSGVRPEELKTMGQRSLELAKQFTPERFADSIELRAASHLNPTGAAGGRDRGHILSLQE